MIKFTNKADFLNAGLGFTDFFEETLFEYYLEQDGFMLYNPVDRWMYDDWDNKIFFVEQTFLGQQNITF